MISICYKFGILFLKYNNFILKLYINNNLMLIKNNDIYLLLDTIKINIFCGCLIIECEDTIKVSIKNVILIDQILSILINNIDTIKNIEDNITNKYIIISNKKLTYDDNNITISINSDTDKNIISKYDKYYSYEYLLFIT